MQYNPANMENASKILIVPALPYFDLDKVLATVVLARGLQRKHKAHVEILSAKSEWWEKAATIVALEDVDVISKLDTKASQLRLTNLGTAIQSVEWMQENNGIVLSITPESDIQIDLSQLRLEPVGLAYQYIYTLDVRSETELEQLLQSTPETMQNANIYSLNTTEPETSIGAESFLYRDSNVYSDLVARYLSVQETELTPDEASALLSGIYWKTNSLQNFFTTAAVFETAKTLLRQRARLSQVVKKVFSTTSAAHQQLWKEALTNLEIQPGTQIGFSEVSRETAFNFNKELKINPIHNLLVFVDNLDASFVFLPLSEKYTEILCSTFSKEINLRKIFQDHKLKGDTLQGVAAVHMNLSDAKQLVKNLLGLEGKTEEKDVTAIENEPTIEIPNTVNDLEVPTDALTAILAEAAALTADYTESPDSVSETIVTSEGTEGNNHETEPTETAARTGFVEVETENEETSESTDSSEAAYASGYGV